ncbi:hypothetical protein CPAV1605_362 [seawater metagenome]|uniref:YhhN-like protein n=1 Tax=seawater metagenome TaxID=1561972 RepID=A0A5E8CHV3_9ZZZZ
MIPKIGKSLFNTQEIKSVNSNIQYYQNSISSFAYLIASFYLLLYTKYTLINSYIIFLLFIMGIISYLWWAKQNEIIHIFDILIYSSLILIIGLKIKVKIHEINESQFFIYNIIFLISLLLLLNLNRLNIIKIINVISGIYSFIYLYYNESFLVVSILCLSIFLKLVDSLKLFKLSLISGTALFHILSAVGYLLLLK